MLPLNEDCDQDGTGTAAHARHCRVPVSQAKWQCEGWESHGKDYLSLFLMSICHKLAERSSDGSLGWVQSPRPKWDRLGLSGSAWPECQRTYPGRGPALGFLSSGCFASALRGTQCLKQNHQVLLEQFLSPRALLQRSGRGDGSTAALAHQFLPQFPC